MVPLLNAKEWFKARRGKKRNTSPPIFVPGIGYPPPRNSSQPTLIPYVPPSGSTGSEREDDSFEDYDGDFDLTSDDMTSAVTTTCVSYLHGQRANHSYEQHSGSNSSATLVAPTPPHRRSSLQPPIKPFSTGYNAKHSGSHNSLPARVSPNGVGAASDRRGSEQILHSLPQPQPQSHQGRERPPNALKNLSSKFSASSDSIIPAHSKAQEYARTVKTLWQMVEDKDLAHRLADSSPVEREWLIFNHKNANFPLKSHPGRSSSESNRSRGGQHHHHSPSHGRDLKLTRIDEAGNIADDHRRGQSTMMSLPISTLSGSDDSKKIKRSTLLSAEALQSAKELQKRDNFTIQQRVDMEEDWRLKARLLRGVDEHQDRARPLQQKAPVQEYTPTHADFNKWYDLKQEVEDDAEVDLNDNIQAFDLKEEIAQEEARKRRELEEQEAKKQRELEELEHELNILGIDRFAGLMSFVESDRPPQVQQMQPSQTVPEQVLLHQQKQEMLHQQLQYQYEQLQLQLKLQQCQTSATTTG
ncbi:hypothetical protein BGZ98_005343, partial [Dissophora globulifera]